MERKAITSRESLTIKRHFSTEGIDPFSAVKWVKRDISIMGRDKIPVFERAGVLVPENWSSNAAQIVVSKYCSAVENVHDLIKRVVDTIAGWGRDDTYFETQADTEAFRSELAELLLTQKAAFNSPVYFNVGRKKDPQCSACFILSAPDSMEGIMELATTEARLFKQGSGCGSNLSTIRSSCEALSGGGTASGPISFMQGLDTFAGAVKSGGTTRRAAKMVVLNVDHPDIESFIDVKKEAEEDARVLSAAGRVGTLDAPKVFFQNANHSVRITDAFMRAVQEDASWPLIAVTTNDVVAEIPARTLFTKIAEAAWDCGDPGVQFHDSVNRWHTCPEDGDITGSNPCGEYMFLEESACNLASLNLCTFLDSDGTFNVESFSQAVRIMFTAQEILIDRSSYPTEAITHNSRQFRPLGLGYANLGALLMRLGIPYDSEKGRATSACITALMGGVAYAHSAEMARSKGPFKGFEKNKRSMRAVIAQHADALNRIPSGTLLPDVFRAAQKSWSVAQEMGVLYGFRNAQATVLAPTGTISFMMDCDTTGVEPPFSLVTQKNMVGGGHTTITIKSIPYALQTLGYSEDDVQKIVTHITEQGPLATAPGIRKEHLNIFATAIGENPITPEGHVAMMASVQPFLSGAISKTVNMPRNSTAEDIEGIFLLAWEKGVKAIAIYRDGSKDQQVLSSSLDTKTEATEIASEPVRRKLPSTRNSITHKFEVGGHKGYITVGLYEDGAPGEIFINISKEGSTIGGLMDSFAILASIALQYGVPLRRLVDKFAHTRFEPSGWTGNNDIPMAKSLVDYIFRWLEKQFISTEDETVIHPEKTTPLVSTQKTTPLDAPMCPNCGSIMIRNGSCHSCGVCGATTGCG